ncbi:MAG: hypothetical protein ACXAD7_15500 [Candidatus Kariarchaeaceae archaeon]|jgi:hypothetical protein
MEGRPSAKINQNRNLIHQWVNHFNNRNWVDFALLFHPDFRVKFDDAGLFRMRNFNLITRNFDELRKAAGIETSFDLESDEHELSSLDTMLKITRAEAEIENTTKTIIDLVADESKVWLKIGQEVTEITTQMKIYNERIDQLRIVDGKIIEHDTFSDYFSALINIGKLIIATNEDVVIKNYLSSLKDMGILP